MNIRFFTGYLPKAAEFAWAPATHEHGPLPRLLFDVMIRDSRGNDFPEKCLIDEEKLISDYRAFLTAGRMVVVQGEQTARQYIDRHGVKGGFVREVRVQRVEFPNRSGKDRDVEEAEAVGPKAHA